MKGWHQMSEQANTDDVLDWLGSYDSLSIKKQSTNGLSNKNEHGVPTGRGLEPPCCHAGFTPNYLGNILTLLNVGQLEQGVQQTHNVSLPDHQSESFLWVSDL